MSFLKVHDRLLAAYGPQHWWPARTPFEVMVGAVLTQNTAWSNVEKAIANLHAAGALDADKLLCAPLRQVAQWLRPAGYFNVKAKRLRNFCAWYAARGGEAALGRMETAALRRELLAVNGVGRETADDILLYAFHRPVFVIDAYTRRIFGRLALLGGDEPYDEMRERIEAHLRRSRRGLVPLYNEYHALIVRHGKDVCKKSKPRCAQCCLAKVCPTTGG
jgi:endonuclease-3 related protein